MTPDPVALKSDANCTEAAMLMNSQHIGTILVNDNSGKCMGILTDRDITTRCVAEGINPESQDIGSICSKHPAELSPDADVHEAVRLMREKAVRRVPVMENGTAIGIVSMGDLAMELDPKSALGEVSSKPANN